MNKTESGVIGTPELTVNDPQNVPFGDASRPSGEAGRNGLLNPSVGQPRQPKPFQTTPELAGDRPRTAALRRSLLGLVARLPLVEKDELAVDPDLRRANFKVLRL